MLDTDPLLLLNTMNTTWVCVATTSVVPDSMPWIANANVEKEYLLRTHSRSLHHLGEQFG